MPILRLLLVSVLAAVSGCAAASLIFYGTIDRSSFIPLLFTVPSAILLLAPAYGGLKERGMPLLGRYLLVLLLGAIAGAMMLGFIFLHPEGAMLGGGYGLVTAVCWIILHFASRRVTGPSR